MAAQDSAAQTFGQPEPAELASAPGAAALPPFEVVYQKYFDFVWASTRRLGVSLASTDDVVQEIFMVIHSKLQTLRQPESLRSWIYGIVRRTVSGHHRSQRTKAQSGAALAIETEIFYPVGPTPQDLSEQSDKVKLLFSLLEGIEERKREVFILAELEEMSVPEIAEALEIPLNTAYSRLRAARIAFEERLARHEGKS
jgi:RNA polymerase sigma-70 factor (ECF subfamily)